MEHGTDFEALLAQSDWLRRLALGLVRDPDAAEDVVQDTCVAALRGAPRGDQGALRSWLATVARNFARRRGRDERLRTERERDAGTSRARREDADEPLARAELQKELAAHVVALDEPHRSTIVLRYFDGLKNAELAERLGITHEAARQRTSRALARLRERLDRARGGDRAAWSVLCLRLVEPAPSSTPLWPWITPVMSTKTKLALASLAIVLLGAWWWRDARPSSAEVPAVASSMDELDATRDPRATRAVVDATELTRTPLAETPATPSSRASAPDDEHALRGVVVDEANTPIEGADVVAWTSLSFDYDTLDLQATKTREKAGDTTSAADGTFRIPVETGRAHQVSVTHAGFAPSTLGRRSAGESVRVVLQRGGELAGRVTAGDAHRACAGANVRCFLLGNDSPDSARFEVETKTDADGRYRFDGLPPRKLMIEVDAAGEPSSGWLPVVVRANEIAERDVHLASRAWARGRVVDALTRAPIAGAEVSGIWTFTKTFRTDAEGAFAVPFDATIQHGLAARAKGYATADLRLASGGRDRDVEGLELVLVRGWSARGRVVDDAGRGVEGAYVAACAAEPSKGTPSWIVARTDARGAFTVEDLRRDVLYTLFARSPGRAAVSYRFPRVAPDASEVDLPDVVLPPSGSIRGVLVDDAGEPVAHGEVTLRGANADRGSWSSDRVDGTDRLLASRERQSDDRGRFTFDELAAGVYSIEYGDGHGRVVPGERIELASGQALDGARIVVPRGGRIAGALADDSGAPIAGASVYVRPEHGDERTGSTRTDEHGRFAITGLAGGPYRLDASPARPASDAPNGTFATGVVRRDVRTNGAELELVAPSGVWLRGRVVGERDEPVAGALVFGVATDDGPAASAYADAEGRFALPVARGVAYDVSAQVEGRSELVTIGGGERTRAVGGSGEITVRCAPTRKRG